MSVLDSILQGRDDVMTWYRGVGVEDGHAWRGLVVPGAPRVRESCAASRQ
jgi:hypothetical protein